MRAASRIRKFLLISILSLAPVAASLADKPRVIASIKPIHSLVAGVMQGIGSPELLISGGQSPHAFTLRPSDARKLNRAKLLFWVGEELEAPLERIIETLGDDIQAIALTGAEGMELLPIREGGVWEEHQHDDEHEHEEHAHADKEHHQGTNPHIWLSPENAAQIVRLAQQELSSIDPDNTARYQANATTMLRRISQLDMAIKEKIEAVSGAKYIVFHDAYPYFEHHYKLTPVGSVTLSPERIPGARRIKELRNKVRSLGASCVFSEPQFEPKLVQTITEGTEAATGILDPLGAELPPGTEAYFNLMHNLANALVDCLGKRGDR
ncbi:MAG: zinc ABC transporter substrate-binding protein [Candidatus Sedimenticola sp. 20ELBAFRAG]